MYLERKSCHSRHFSYKIVMRNFHVQLDYFPDYLIEEELQECRFKANLEEAQSHEILKS